MHICFQDILVATTHSFFATFYLWFTYCHWARSFWYMSLILYLFRLDPRWGLAYRQSMLFTWPWFFWPYDFENVINGCYEPESRSLALNKKRYKIDYYIFENLKRFFVEFSQISYRHWVYSFTWNIKRFITRFSSDWRFFCFCFERIRVVCVLMLSCTVPSVE